MLSAFASSPYSTVSSHSLGSSLLGVELSHAVGGISERAKGYEPRNLSTVISDVC